MSPPIFSAAANFIARVLSGLAGRLGGGREFGFLAGERIGKTISESLDDPAELMELVLL
jgi:hypothetical protein